MRTMLIGVMVLTLSATGAVSAHRSHVRIHKEVPPVAIQQPLIAIPVAVIPVLGMFYDISRRTNCQGDILGLGGPGFTEPTPIGNVMTTAYQRGECGQIPK